MANIIDYMKWRGDLRFSQAGLNAVDSLILSCLSYVGFDGIVSGDKYAAPVPLHEAAQKYFALNPDARRMRAPEDENLLRAASICPRFQDILLTRYVNRIDDEAQTQFSAVTLLLGDGTAFISYRGTDNTLVGWKEDFNMSFLTPVPAQQRAAEYLTQADSTQKLYLGGHSKGGNLAVFAAAFTDKAVQDRIVAVYNHDGPGFDAKVLSSNGYSAVRDRIQTFVPQSSVVGMLLEHEEHYTVVHSTQKGLMQHDPYSWETLGTDFVRLDTISNGSRFIDQSLKTWVAQMDVSQREQFFDTLYHVLKATKAERVTELSEGWLKNAVVILRSFQNIDEQSRQHVFQMLSLLLAAAKDNFSIMLPPIPAPPAIQQHSKKNNRRTSSKKQKRAQLDK